MRKMRDVCDVCVCVCDACVCVMCVTCDVRCAICNEAVMGDVRVKFDV